MRRLAAAALTITLLLLSACAGRSGDDETALKVRAALAGADGCAYTMDVHADCDGRLYDFQLAYAAQGGGATVTVLAPELLAGVRASVDEDGTDLTFDGLELALEDGAAGAASPLLLPWLLHTCLQSAYIAYTAQDEGGTAVRYQYGYDETRLEVQVLLDRASLVPLNCEVFQDGQVILSAEISDFRLVEDT